MQITIKIDDFKKEYEYETSVLEVMKDYLGEDYKKALACFCGGKVYELNHKLKRNCELNPIYYNSEEGKRIYERSLSLLTIAAIKKLFPSKHVFVEDAVGRSLNIKLLDKVLNHTEVEQIQNEMRSLVDRELDITKEKVDVDQAIELFKKLDQPDKVDLLSYRRTKNITIYNLDGTYDYFYGAMLPNTSYLSAFELTARYPGFMVNYPKNSSMEITESLRSHKKQYRVFAESQEWCKILNATTVADVNKMIENGEIREFIRINEALHDSSISKIAQEVIDNKARIILIFGPSCSGKTTFTHRLDVHLKVHGLKPLIISLDDFYKNKEDLIPDENGEIDLETIDALDIDYITKCFDDLLAGEEVALPHFNFKTGKREASVRKVKLEEDQPILVEGIHAMNDKITTRLPEQLCFGIYVSPLTCLKLDNHNRIHTSDARLLRRIVRDMQFRGTPPEETINMWKSVKDGERKWIYPNQEKADVMFNTTLHYELPLLHSFIYASLDKIGVDNKNFIDARRIVKSLNYLLPIGNEVLKEIPPLSILREFIGGCSFYIRD